MAVPTLLALCARGVPPGELHRLPDCVRQQALLALGELYCSLGERVVDVARALFGAYSEEVLCDMLGTGCRAMMINVFDLLRRKAGRSDLWRAAHRDDAQSAHATLRHAVDASLDAALRLEAIWKEARECRRVLVGLRARPRYDGDPGAALGAPADQYVELLRRSAVLEHVMQGFQLDGGDMVKKIADCLARDPPDMEEVRSALGGDDARRLEILREVCYMVEFPPELWHPLDLERMMAESGVHDARTAADAANALAWMHMWEMRGPRRPIPAGGRTAEYLERFEIRMEGTRLALAILGDEHCKP